jgi:hypothetical protein
MKNMVFLAGALMGLLVLFGLRYQFNVIGDQGFKIIAVVMLISVLIIRSKLNISFFNK